MIIKRRGPVALKGPGAKPERPRHKRPQLQTPYVAPRDPTERELAEIWGALLGIDAVGIHDGFFELGGDSLLAIQLLSRVREATSHRLTLRQVFELRTIAGLAAEIAAGGGGEAEAAEVEAMLAAVEGLSPEEARRQLESVDPSAAKPDPEAPA